MDVSSSHAKTVASVRVTMEVSDAFAPSRAKAGAYMEGRPALLHFLAVMTSNVRMEEYAPPYL